MGRCRRVAALTCCMAALAAASHAATMGELDEALRGCTTYQVGQSRVPLTTAEALIRTLRKDPAVRKQIEARLAAMLGSGATADCKRFACRQLSIVGTATAVPALAKLLTDPDLAHMARYALERIPDPAAANALRDALGKLEGKLLVGVINSVGRRTNSAAVAPLARLIADKDGTVAAAAVAALGKIGGEQALATLDAAKPKLPPRLRPLLTDSRLLCADRLVAQGNKQAAAAVYRQLYESAGEKRHHRIAALRGLLAASGTAAWKLVIDILASDDRAMWPHAAASAAGFPGAEATKALASHLPKLSAGAQVLLLSALATRGDAAALPGVLAAAKGQDQGVRVAALDALGPLGDASCVPTLAKVAATGKGGEQTAARGSLHRLRGRGVDAAIVAAMQGAEPPLRVELIGALAARRATAAMPQLLGSARDADPSVRKEALKALAAIADEKALPQLVTTLAATGAKAERRRVERAVAKIVGRVPDHAAAARPILAALPEAKPNVRSALLRILGRIPSDSSLAALRTALKHSDAAVQDAAVRSLADWPDARPADDLLAIARATTNKTHRVLALRGFVRMATTPGAPPAADTVRRLADAMSLAKRPEDRKMVLGGLAKVHHVAALDAALPHLADPAVEAEAAAAIVEVATAVRKTHRKEAVAAVGRILQTCKTPAVRQAAENALIVVGQAVNIAPQGVATSPDGLEKDGGAGGDQAAIDGNPTTYWDEVNGKKLYRYVVTFRQPERIHAISILGYEHHNYAPKDFEVLCDGKVAKTVRNAQYSNNILVVRLGEVTCKAVELKITGYYGLSPAIRELGIYAPGGKLPAPKP